MNKDPQERMVTSGALHRPSNEQDPDKEMRLSIHSISYIIIPRSSVNLKRIRLGPAADDYHTVL